MSPEPQMYLGITVKGQPARRSVPPSLDEYAEAGWWSVQRVYRCTMRLRGNRSRGVLPVVDCVHSCCSTQAAEYSAITQIGTVRAGGRKWQRRAN
jgi:hypothetical protein